MKMKHIAIFALVLTSPLFSLTTVHAAGWATISTGVSGAYKAIDSDGANDLMAIASNSTTVSVPGSSITSTDNGTTWATATSPSLTTDVSVIDSTSAIAVRSGLFCSFSRCGIIDKTTDSGATWATHLSGSSVQGLNAVTMYSDLIGWAVGDSGSIYKTTNSGTSWIAQTSGTTNDLESVDFVSSTIGWAVGTSGTILKTTDGGATWMTKISGTTEKLNAISALNINSAFAVGTNATILKTSDGGGNWSKESVSGLLNFATIYKVAMYSVTHGLIGTSAGLFETTDGTNWSNVTDLDSEVVKGLVYNSSGVRFAVTESGNLYRYDEGAPSAPTNLSNSSAASDTTPTFTWTASTDSQTSIASYEVSTDSSTFVNIGNVTTYTSSTLLDGGHTFAVRAVDAAGNVSTNASLTISITTSGGSVSTGTLIKTACSASAVVNDPCTAVYYYGSDNKRHAFPNSNIYFTWYTDFNDVLIVSSDFLASIHLGSNVTYHPGTKMVKFVTVNTVYAVAQGGELRAVASESVAASLYGSTWNRQIDDVSDAFFGNYHFGSTINSSADYSPSAEAASVTSIDDNL